MKIQWNRTYKYVKWPVECLVQLQKVHHNSGGQKNYDFKIIGRAKYHNYDANEVIANPIQLRHSNLKNCIFELDEIITSVKDIQ